MRDHGGRISDAIAEFGGNPEAWIDLSTGINPHPYPLPALGLNLWNRLPDPAAERALLKAARRFWNVPETCDILAANGASALIAAMPLLRAPAKVQIAQRTYNEHEAAFTSAGWQVTRDPAQVQVIVRPNNPDGVLVDLPEGARDLLVVDESFGDVTPYNSAVAQAADPGVIILKSFGKFWGLAGLRVGFAIGNPTDIALLRDRIGPWPVSGPALEIATQALWDHTWATATRATLAQSARRLDAIFEKLCEAPPSGTDLFRLISTNRALDLYTHLASRQILTRIFPYDANWLRVGLPGSADEWTRLEAAVQAFK